MDFQEFEELIDKGAKEITLDSDIKITQGTLCNRKIIEIKADDLTIDGNNWRLSGENHYGIFRILGNNITLKNFVFCDAQGGAIENGNGTLNIENCIFINNKVDTYVYEDHSHTTVIIPHDLENGAAIYNDEGIINIKNCIFEANVSKDGGAIYNEEGKIVCINSSFKDNSSENDGNAIYNLNGEFMIDGCDFRGENSEIIFNNHEMHIDNSHFESHHIIINRSELISPYEDKIINQKVSGYLDSLIHSDNKEIVFNEDIIMYFKCIDVDVNDLSIDGTGHKIQGKTNRQCLNISGKNLTFKNIVFEEGFVEISKDADVTLENCIFKSGDEAIIINRSNLTLKDCTFEKHHIIRNEGVIQTDGNVNTKIFEIKRLNINDLTEGEFKLDSNVIIEGYDTDEICLDELTIDGSGFTIESERLNLLEINRLTLKNVNFEIKYYRWLSLHVNESLEIINCKINGEVRIDNFAGTVTIENTIFDKEFKGIENNQGKVKIEKSNFSNIYNSSVSLLVNHGDLYLKECSFDNNHVNDHEKFNGGIIYNNKDGKALLENCLFRKTRIGYHSEGGAIFNEGSLTSVNCKFIENHSQRYGGAISNYGELRLAGCDFIDNVSDLDASAIYNNGVLNVDDCQFKGKQESVIVNDNEIAIKKPKIEKHHKILTSDNIHISRNDHNILKDQILVVRDTQDLIDLIHSGKKEIELNGYFYANDVSIDVDDLIIDGNGNTIDARLNTNIFKINANNVVLKNIVFKNIEWVGDYSSAIYTYDKTLKIENCTFEKNNGGNGAAIYNETGQIIIIDSIFKENTADYDVNGGAINNFNGYISINNCVFLDNKAGYCGGAIYNEYGAIDLCDCDFNDNCCKYLGETLMIWYGGAIYNGNGEITINKCNFTGNFSSGPGDAIFNSSSIHIKNSVFKGEGADDIANYYFASIESCQFENSLIANYGTIICRNETDDLNLIIENHSGNLHNVSDSASTDYGFKDLDNLINSDSDEIIIDNNVCLQDKEIELYTKGIEIKRDNLVIDAKGNYIDSNFNGSIFKVNAKNIVFKNIVFKKAGILNHSAIESMDSEITFEDCCFYNNLSDCGASIQSDSSSLKFKNCKFKNNRTSKDGSIRIINSDLNLEKCEFESESSSNVREGRAIFAEESNLNIFGCEFKDISNVCMHLKSSFVELNDCKFLDNYILIEGHRINALVQNCLFENNNKVVEGNFIISSKINLTQSDAIFKNTLFDNNRNFSILILSKETKLSLIDCDFENNAANPFLILNDNLSDLILKKCNFKGDFKKIIKSVNAIKVSECNFKKDHIIIGELIDMEFTEIPFRNIIYSGEKGISLEEDYALFEEVKLDVDGLCIDGKLHKIYGNLVITGKDICLKNINFQDPIKIENDGSVTFENCSFKSNNPEVIINNAKLTLKDCNFKNEHIILNTGEVTLINEDGEEVSMNEIIYPFVKKLFLRKRIKPDKDDELNSLGRLGRLFD